MQQIAVKEVIDVRYLLGTPTESKGRYNQLKATFPEGKEYQLFSDPLISGEKFIWMTEYEGKILNIMQLSEEDQSLTKNKLSLQIQKLLTAAKKFDDIKLIEFLYKCIEIPTLKDIFIVKGANEDKIVLTQWGFISDKPGAEKGLLDKIINAKRVPMIFKVRYEDQSVAADEEVYFEFEGKKEIFRSNSEGIITLESVKVDSYVKTYQTYKNEIINIKGFTCAEYGDYLITVAQKVNMLFKVKGTNEQLMPNQTFTFKYEENEVQLTSNEKGEITLTKIRLTTEVNAFQKTETKTENTHNFICEKEKEFYLLIIEVPVVVVEPEKQYNMKFQVLDQKNNPIPDAEVTLTYGGKTVNVLTDNQGFTILNDIKPGTKVKVIAKKNIK